MRKFACLTLIITLLFPAILSAQILGDESEYQGTTSDAARKQFNKGVDYMRESNLKKAKKSYIKAIKLDGNYVEAYDNLGLTYRKIGDYDKAIEAYKESSEIFPNGIFAHQNLAVVYSMQERYDLAVGEYDEIIRIDSKNPEGYYGRGNAYMLQGEFDAARTNALKAIELYKAADSDHLGDGYYMMGLINYFDEDMPAAREWLEKAEDEGVQVHQKVRDEVFTPENEKTGDLNDMLQLKEAEDYEKTEQKFLNSVKWLQDNPIGSGQKQREEELAFVVVWCSGTPYVSIMLSEEIAPYMKEPELMVMFMGSWAQYALEEEDDDQLNCAMASTEKVIAFYKKNKSELGKIKSLDKFIEMQTENTLRAHLESQLEG